MGEKVIGIIAEFNPFHLGHKYLIKRAREITKAKNVVVLMSGNTVQRGDFSIVDKFSRAKEAIISGVDLVLELPFCYASQSAEYFSKGAVNILNKLDIDFLCFGSESDNIENQVKIAEILLQNEEDIYKEFSKNAKGNAAFERQKILESFFGEYADFSLMNTPNDILAIEYIKALKKFKSDVVPISVKRVGNEYHDKNIGDVFSSATSLREILKSDDSDIYYKLSNATTKTMAGYLFENRKNIVSFDSYFDELKAIIIRDENLDEIFEVKEGIENLVRKATLKSKNLQELIFAVKSKRYTYTRIRRLLFNIFAGLKKKDMQKVLAFDENVYTRILAFNNSGRKLLKKYKQKMEEETLSINKDIDNKLVEDNSLQLINKLSTFKPKNEAQEILYRLDKRVNRLYYAKYFFEIKGKRIITDEETSPLYIE